MSRRIVAAVFAAALVLSVTGSAVLAGEITGNGGKTDQNQGMSWCSFSGQNDRVTGEGPTDTEAQSFGQDNSTAVHMGAGPIGGRDAGPGTFCNPNRSPLGPNPNRTR